MQASATRITALVVLLTCALASAQQPRPRPARPGSGAERPGPAQQPELPEPVKKVAQANNAFALDLYARLRQQQGNLFFSPASIHTALAMTYAGARARTGEQMAGVLHLDERDQQLHEAYAQLLELLKAPQGEQPPFELSVANALWGQQGYAFRPAYLELVEKNYGGALRQVDFATNTEQARVTINDWVSDRTNRRIRDLLPPGVIDDMTRLVLTNAIYFKGNWVSPFDPKLTRNEPFHIGPQRRVEVPMMQQKALAGYYADDDLQALELAYKGDALSMVILLPAKMDGLADLEQALTTQKLQGYLQGLRRREVRMFIPKFQLTEQLGLVPALRAMGMTDAFDPGLADLSGMVASERKELYISAVVHKAFVDVNELGTEAAAATGVVVGVRAAPIDEPPTFRADHPFLLLICERRSGAILFLGRLTNP